MQDDDGRLVEAGAAARIAAQHYRVSTYAQPAHDDKHVVWQMPELDPATLSWPVAFSGTHDECEAWVNAYVVRAALSAIEREGFRVVPVEPTEEMLKAETEWETHEGTPETGPVPINPVRAFWTAMLSAAPKHG